MSEIQVFLDVVLECFPGAFPEQSFLIRSNAGQTGSCSHLEVVHLPSSAGRLGIGLHGEETDEYDYNGFPFRCEGQFLGRLFFSFPEPGE